MGQALVLVPAGRGQLMIREEIKLPPWPVCCREPLIRRAWWNRTVTGCIECCRQCEACHTYWVLRWIVGREQEAIACETGLWEGKPPPRFREKGERRGGRASKDKQASFWRDEE